MFVGLTIAVLAFLDRSAAWLWLRPVWGLMWPPRARPAMVRRDLLAAGDAFFADSIGGDMLSKLGQDRTARRQLYLLLFWITFWPGAPLAGMAAPAIWRARREPARAISAGVADPSWIVFEAVLTKLPHYVLPLYPAIAILTAGALERRSAVTILADPRRGGGSRSLRSHRSSRSSVAIKLIISRYFRPGHSWRQR